MLICRAGVKYFIVFLLRIFIFITSILRLFLSVIISRLRLASRIYIVIYIRLRYRDDFSLFFIWVHLVLWDIVVIFWLCRSFHLVYFVCLVCFSVCCFVVSSLSTNQKILLDFMDNYPLVSRFLQWFVLGAVYYIFLLLLLFTVLDSFYRWLCSSFIV